MPRQTAITEAEEKDVREAVDAFTEAVDDEYGDTVTARSVIGGENGDVEVKLNTREFPTEADGPLDLGPLFEAAHDLGFAPTTGIGYTVTDVGTANESSRTFITFAYTF